MATDLFRRLPPELMQLVLQDLVLSGSLLSTLLSSRYAYHIFENDKDLIVCESVRHYIHPSVFADAARAVSPLVADNEFRFHALKIEHDEDRCRTWEDLAWRRVCKSVPMKERHHVWEEAARRTVISFLQRSPDEHGVAILPLHVTVPICRLLRSIECLSKQLITRIGGLSKEGGDKHLDRVSATFRPGSEIYSPVTTTETARMQRAFFRFQIYCGIFPGRSETLYGASRLRDYPWGLRAHRRIQDLLEAYPPWEIEELLCVYRFLSSEVEKVFDRVQEILIERIVAEQLDTDTAVDASKTRPHEDSSAANGMDRFWTPELDFFMYIDSSEAGKAEALMSLGLNFLSQLTKYGPHVSFEQEKTIPILRRRMVSCLRIVVRFPDLEYEWNWDQQVFEPDAAPLEHQNSDDLTKCNEAYLWSLFYSTPLRTSFAAKENFDLREWGYALWDNARLSRMGILGKPRQRIECNDEDGWDGLSRRKAKISGLCLPGTSQAWWQQRKTVGLAGADDSHIESGLRLLDSCTITG